MTKQTHFEKIVVDFDRILLIASSAMEVKTVIVKNIKTGEEAEFENISTFWGLGKEPKALLGTFLRLLGVKSPKSDWEVTEKVQLNSDITNHLEEAKRKVSYEVGKIKALNVADDYILCIGGKDNFRYDVAVTQPYKGARGPKPLLFEEIREDFLAQYGKRVHVAEGWEADDTLGMYAAESQAHYRKTGKYKYILMYEDKDLRQFAHPMIHLVNQDEGIQEITPMGAATHFAKQMLEGDKSTDNIPGLGKISKDLKEKYKLRTTSCGPATANAILKGCNDPKELFERVVEAYRESHGDVWKEYINEQFRLLWMLRTPNIEVNIFNELLDKLKVEY